MIFHPTPITFYLIGTLKLFEEACIVLGEKAKVVDSIFEVSDTLDTHTESITCIHIGIDVARSEVVRINHSTAEDLYPPVCLQKLQPLPPQMVQEISISALGSVKGKKEGRRRILVSGPNISRAKVRSTCLRSVKLTPLST